MNLILYKSQNYHINVDTSKQILTLYSSGALLNSYPIAVGKPSTLTPKGSFKIVNKAVNPGGPFGVR